MKKRNSFSLFLTGCLSFFVSVLTAQSVFSTMTFSGANRSNYPVIVTHADHGKLPKGCVYSFCTLPPFSGAITDHSDQCLLVVDDSLRPIFTHSTGPFNMMGQGYTVYYNFSDSTMGYNKDSYYYYYDLAGHQVLPQAHGLFPRFKWNSEQKGFVTKDTLSGTGTANHIPPTLDEHGIYMSDSFYVAMQNYNGWQDTGSGLAFIKYDGTVIARWSSQDPVNGIPFPQSYWSSCADYQYFQATDADHPNSVVSVGDSLFIFSNRHQNEVTCVKFNWRTKTFSREWRLRHDAFGSFTWLDDSIGFAGQHALSILSASKREIVLGLFDNGNCVSNESKYLEYRLDLDHMTVTTEHSVPLGYRSVAMGGAFRIGTSNAVLHTPGIFSPNATSVDIVGIKDMQGAEIGGMRFQTDSVTAFGQSNWLVYQARVDSVPFIKGIRPTVSTDCSRGDSMLLTLNQTYDNVLWELTGQTTQSIWLPKASVRTMVTTYNANTVGEWHAYSEGCAQDTAVGIKALTVSNFGLYPNPAHNFVNVVGDLNQGEPYAITDMSGKVVQVGELQPGGINAVKCEFIPGVYLLQFNTGGHTITKKMVVF